MAWPGLEAGLSNQSGLLVAEVAGYGNARDGGYLRGAVHFAAGADLRQHCHRNSEYLRDFGAPCQRFQVHQLRAAGIAYVGHMDTAVRAARELPDQVGIDVAEQHFTGLSQRTDARNVFQDPLDLQSAEVSRQGQSGLAAELILSAQTGVLGT